MYRYFERTSYQGQRYYHGKGTSYSVGVMENHLDKIGTPNRIRGYVYRDRQGVKQVGVMVYGDQGQIRFGGFSWGYYGEGTRGLQSLFARLGITEFDAFTIAAWDGWDKIGTKWELSAKIIQNGPWDARMVWVSTHEVNPAPQWALT